MSATPDSFVAVVPTPWKGDAAALVVQTFEETWAAPATLSLDANLRGVFESEGASAEIMVEEPILELPQLAGSSLEPFGAQDLVSLKEHVSVWRVTVPAGDHPKAAAAFVLKVVSALVEAGASGAMLPMTLRLHSPRTVRLMAVDPYDDQALANLWVHAWDLDGWMRTRGLTAFGLPELDTQINEGVNAAYFRLMDVAANMIERECRFLEGSELMMGHQIIRVSHGPSTSADTEMPLAGHFGVQTLIPNTG